MYLWFSDFVEVQVFDRGRCKWLIFSLSSRYCLVIINRIIGNTLYTCICHTDKNKKKNGNLAQQWYTVETEFDVRPTTRTDTVIACRWQLHARRCYYRLRLVSRLSNGRIYNIRICKIYLKIKNRPEVYSDISVMFSMIIVIDKSSV